MLKQLNTSTFNQEMKKFHTNTRKYYDEIIVDEEQMFKLKKLIDKSEKSVILIPNS